MLPLIMDDCDERTFDGLEGEHGVQVHAQQLTKAVDNGTVVLWVHCNVISGLISTPSNTRNNRSLDERRVYSRGSLIDVIH